jgi:hypothetical protein
MGSTRPSGRPPEAGDQPGDACNLWSNIMSRIMHRSTQAREVAACAGTAAKRRVADDGHPGAQKAVGGWWKQGQATKWSTCTAQSISFVMMSCGQREFSKHTCYMGHFGYDGRGQVPSSCLNLSRQVLCTPSRPLPHCHQVPHRQGWCPPLNLATGGLPTKSTTLVRLCGHAAPRLPRPAPPPTTKAPAITTKAPMLMLVEHVPHCHPCRTVQVALKTVCTSTRQDVVCSLSIILLPSFNAPHCMYKQLVAMRS